MVPSMVVVSEIADQTHPVEESRGNVRAKIWKAEAPLIETCEVGEILALEGADSRSEVGYSHWKTPR